VVFQRSNFAVNDPAFGWNGTLNGAQLSQDVYVYQIDIICQTGQVFSLKGDISLMR
ncbi:MAG: hypothetical protein JWR18_101, partial [Segetibacter sp.]|nr:hypothetical protein [Segetibacter sp.]